MCTYYICTYLCVYIHIHSYIYAHRVYINVHIIYLCMYALRISFPLLTLFDGVLLNHHARCSVCYQMKCYLLVFNLVDSYNSFNSCQFLCENMS